MTICANVLDLLAVVHFPDHYGDEESFHIHTNFHGKKVKIVGFCSCPKLKVKIVDENGSLSELIAEIFVWDLIFEPI